VLFRSDKLCPTKQQLYQQVVKVEVKNEDSVDEDVAVDVVVVEDEDEVDEDDEVVPMINSLGSQSPS